jgi:hypothetical protein
LANGNSIGRDGLLAAVVAGDLDLVALQQLAGAKVAGDLVGLEQLGHPTGELLDDLFLAPDEGLEVDLGVLHADAVHREIVRDVVELLGGIEQRLRRDAAHVEAGAAQRLLAVLADPGVDAGRLQAELRGADRGVITGRAAADDDDVELFLFAHFIRSRDSGLGIRDSQRQSAWRRGESRMSCGPGWEGIRKLRARAFTNPGSRIPNPRPRQRPSNILCGFSSWFLMSTRNSTASLPSMMRWS